MIHIIESKIDFFNLTLIMQATQGGRVQIDLKFRTLVGSAFLVITSTVALAQTSFNEDFAAELYEGQTAAAIALAEEQLSVFPADQQATFALGSAQFLSAIEKLGQGLYRYGLQSNLGAAGMTGLPFLRLPVPMNPQPDQVTYEGLRSVLDRFVDDLAEAESTLAGVGPEPFDLSIHLARIRLDYDGDGKKSDRESLRFSFTAALGRFAVNSGYLVDFDQSDAPWLQGYCHLLSAMAEFPLAHNWEAAFNQTFHSVFPKSDLPSSELVREIAEFQAALDAFRDENGSFPTLPRKPIEPPRGNLSWEQYQKSDAYVAYLQSEPYKAYRQELSRYHHYKTETREIVNNAKYKELLGRELYGSVADLIAFVHLFNWPVVEPERMAAVRLHLLDMIALSRENWRRILLEEDDNREWVPSPKQSGIFQRIRVDDDTVAAWHNFLDEFEAILEGRRLIKHWRFVSKGVNLRRMFEEPRTFDPVLIAQGSGVFPFLEEGDLVTGNTAQTMFDLFDGDFFAYFIWFN